MTQDANLRLTGKQLRLVEEGLRNAFIDFNDLARLVLYDLDEHLNYIVVQHATFRDQIVQLIQWAEAKGKTKDLLLAAAREVPGNARLREAKQAVLGDSGLDDLEKIVSSNSALFSDPDAWRRAMIQAEWAVCRVEKPEGQPALAGRDRPVQPGGRHHGDRGRPAGSRQGPAGVIRSGGAGRSGHG
jgi:hypothetical protein